jgi:hypothetical protein
MELKYFLCAGAGVASFLIVLANGKSLRALWVPPAVAGAITVAQVLLDSKGFSFLGLIGIVVFFFLATLGPGICSLIGYVLGSYARSFKSGSRIE